MVGEREVEQPDDDLQLVDVFISHRSTASDQAVARQLADRLQAAGVRCFLDTKDISSGDSFIRTILSSVRRCRLVVVLFNEEVSNWLLFEASLAFFDEKLLPVAINDCEVPLPYGRIQHEGIQVGTNGAVSQ